jgi:hypothetical protein
MNVQPFITRNFLEFVVKKFRPSEKWTILACSQQYPNFHYYPTVIQELHIHTHNLHKLAHKSLNNIFADFTMILPTSQNAIRQAHNSSPRLNFHCTMRLRSASIYQVLP